MGYIFRLCRVVVAFVAYNFGGSVHCTFYLAFGKIKSQKAQEGVAHLSIYCADCREKNLAINLCSPIQCLENADWKGL